MNIGGNILLKPKLWTKNFINIAIANFLAFTTFYYLLITLPIYTLQELNGNESEAGLIVTIFLVAAIITRPFAGKWIERIGKYPVFFVAFLIVCGSSFFYFYNAIDHITAYSSLFSMELDLEWQRQLPEPS